MTIPAPTHSPPIRTEQEAAGQLQLHLTALRESVRDLLQRRGHDGMTGSELAQLLPRHPESTARSRLSELTLLKHGRVLYRTTHVRRNHRGNNEHVYVWHEHVRPCCGTGKFLGKRYGDR